MAATLRHSSVLTTDADYIDDLRSAAEFIKSKLPPSDLAIVLGSGLQDFEKNLSDTSVVSYADIPGMPLPKVAGHPGRFISGVLPGGRRIYCLAGRSHCYEGYSFLTVAFPPNLLALLGVKIFVATNAAGGGPGIRVAKVDGDAEPLEQMHPGVLMLISDHVNNLLRNPIEEVSMVLDLPEQYLSGETLYSQRLRTIARQTYQQLQRSHPDNMNLYEGTYACFSGPTYETTTEVVSASRELDIHAFGMSTVPDVMLARACGLECLAISLITNMAAGISGASLSHTEVTETGSSAANSFETYMSALLSAIPTSPVEPRDIPFPSALQTSLILPRPVPRTATSEELLQAASYLRSALELRSVEDDLQLRSALFFGPPHSPPPSLLTDASATVSVASVPGFPVFSTAGKTGTLSLHRQASDNALIAVVNTNDHLGFCTLEASFLVSVLRLLGISHAGLLVSAGSTDLSAAPVGSVVSIVDYFDVSTITSAPPPAHLSLVAADALPAHACAFFPGPTYPSTAELGIATKSDIPLSAIVHSHLISALLAASLPLVVVATVDYAAPKSEDGLAAVATAEATATALEHLLRHTSATSYARLPITDLQSLSSKHVAISSHLSRPVTQGNLQAVARDVQAIRQSLLANDAACPPVVLYERALPALAADFTILDSFNFDLGEGIADHSSTCRLSLAETAGRQRLLILQSAPAESSGAPLGTLLHPLRVVASLRPPAVLSVLRLFSSAELHPTQLVPVRDHVNRSGRNPLFGTNIAEWGERFFDVQTLYRNELREKLAASITKVTGSQPNNAVVCYGIGPLPISPAALRVLRTYRSSAWAFSHIPEHLTLHHMGIPVAALGVVSSSSDQVVDAQELTSTIADFFSS